MLLLSVVSTRFILQWILKLTSLYIMRVVGRGGKNGIAEKFILIGDGWAEKIQIFF